MAEPTLSPVRLLIDGACAIDTRLLELFRALDAVPTAGEAIPLSVWWGLPSTTLSDRWWSLRCLDRPEVAGGLLAAVEACRRSGLTLSQEAPGIGDLEEAWDIVESVALGRHLGFDALQVESEEMLREANRLSCTHHTMTAQLLAATAFYLQGDHARAAKRVWSVYSLGLYTLSQDHRAHETEALSQVLDLEAYVLRGER